MREIDIKSKLRKLRKLKRDARKGTPLRNSLNKQIRELKGILDEMNACSPEKKILIDKLMKIKLNKANELKEKYPKFDEKRFMRNVNYKQFDIETLSSYYKSVTSKDYKQLY